MGHETPFIEFSPDGTRIFTGAACFSVSAESSAACSAADQKIAIWSAADLTPIASTNVSALEADAPSRTYGGLTYADYAYVTCMALSPDGTVRLADMSPPYRCTPSC
jgi:WD40 repeat protein